jgi:hypothetical protein
LILRNTVGYTANRTTNWEEAAVFELKPISKDATTAALERAERYRLLNEPMEAESICLDVLEADPGNQRAIVIMILSLTDQFGTRLGAAFAAASALLSRLDDPYARAYYDGVICERRAKSHMSRGGHGARFQAYEWIQRAMHHFEEAESIRPPHNDESLLRWNTCVRILERHPELEPAHKETVEHMLE